MTDFLNNRKQRVPLNGEISPRIHVEAWAPQGSILGPLLFLIYIKDLSENLASRSKLFADDTSPFSVVKELTGSSAINLNSDLANNWANQWIITFNLDPRKQAQKLIVAKTPPKSS